MWVRSGMWVGKPHEDKAEQFASGVEQVLVPEMRQLPGVISVAALWPQRLEDNPPDIHCQILVRFASLEDLEGMLASKERAALRPKVRAVAELFDGRIAHIDFEEGTGA